MITSSALLLRSLISVLVKDVMRIFLIELIVSTNSFSTTGFLTNQWNAITTSSDFDNHKKIFAIKMKRKIKKVQGLKKCYEVRMINLLKIFR